MKFEKSNKVISSELISFDKKYKLIIPEVYRQFLLNQNGGRLNGSYVYSSKTEEFVVEGFLGVSNGEKYFDLSLQYAILKSFLPKGYFPIASDAGGNYYIVNLDVKRAPVYFWDHNLQTTGTKAKGLKRIADSFIAFLEGIKLDTTEVEVEVIRKDGKIILK